MAEQKPASERTEKPTRKRLRDARAEGQVARSRELTAFALVGAGLIALTGFGGWIAHEAMRLMAGGLRIDAPPATNPAATLTALTDGLWQALWLLLPMFGATLVAAVLAPLALGGWNFSAKAVAPKGSRMSPIQGLQRVFSSNGLGELGKALLKVVLLGGVALGFAWINAGKLLDLGRMPAERGIVHGLDLCLDIGVWMLVGLILIALVDVPLQLYNHDKQLRMTRQEVRDEHKEVEGRPEVKQAQRQRQQEAAGRQNLAAVPTADVVVTNPTHVAVALQYDPDQMRAPTVLASGADLVAAHIRELARESEVPLVSAPPLARALYHLGDVGREIPVDLYKAVAQLLTYVYQLRHQAPGERAPELPEFELPETGRR